MRRPTLPTSKSELGPTGWQLQKVLYLLRVVGKGIREYGDDVVIIWTCSGLSLGFQSFGRVCGCVCVCVFFFNGFGQVVIEHVEWAVGSIRHLQTS